MDLESEGLLNAKVIDKMMNRINNDKNRNNNNNNNNKNILKSPRGTKMVFDNRIKRKNVLALNEKVAAIREYQKRPIYKRIGRMFHCSPDQIKRIVQQKDAILTAWEQRTRKRDAKTLEMKVVRVSMLGKAVYEWIRRMMYYKDILITDGLIQKMALQFKSAMGLQNFFPHQDWCDKFRTIYKITETDSKLLTIGYTTGHSVQIKDVIKDVLSECSPDCDVVQNDDDKRENNTKQNNGLDSLSTTSCNRSHSTVGRLEGVNLNTNSKSKDATKCSSTVPCSALTPFRQLVALPLQNGTLPGGGQKVLVATPLTTANQRQGNATPMTMTIIPLATIGQPSNLLPTTNTSSVIATTTAAVKKVRAETQITVPPPIMEIKKEIKEESTTLDDTDTDADADADADTDAVNVSNHLELVKIKSEYPSDPEIVNDDSNGHSDRSDHEKREKEEEDKHKKTKITAHALKKISQPFLVSPTSKNTGKLFSASQQQNRMSINEEADSTNDSLEDVTLAKLKHHIKHQTTSNKKSSGEKKSISRTANYRKRLAKANKFNESLNGAKTTTPLLAVTGPTTIVNVPPLIRVAPTLTNHDVYSKSQLFKTNNDSHNAVNSTETTPIPFTTIKSCAQARAYLKLLEDFALERESFRLIGLITRADEVLRELDRKENGGTSDNDIEDIDID